MDGIMEIILHVGIKYRLKVSVNAVQLLLKKCKVA